MTKAETEAALKPFIEQMKFHENEHRRAIEQAQVKLDTTMRERMALESFIYKLKP